MARTVEVIDGKVRYDSHTLAEWVPEIVAQLTKVTEPRRIILFGSVARGDDGPDSDIDIMVVLDSLEYTERHEWMTRLRTAIEVPAPIQIFVTDERECSRRRDVIGSMHYWPLREGKVVFERAS